MMECSKSEENYLKAIYHLSKNNGAGTTAIAEALNTKPASVSDMLKRLANKKLVNYEKYHGGTLTEDGRKVALRIVRKHRLWELFLVEKLNFAWDSVHEIAEQLEHIKSPLLTERLDEFLGFPKRDPHGDLIPNAEGELPVIVQTSLAAAKIGEIGRVCAVNDTSGAFLRFLDKTGVSIGTKMEILDRIEFDGSVEVRINDERTHMLSKLAAENILIEN